MISLWIFWTRLGKIHTLKKKGVRGLKLYLTLSNIASFVDLVDQARKDTYFKARRCYRLESSFMDLVDQVRKDTYIEAKGYYRLEPISNII